MSGSNFVVTAVGWGAALALCEAIDRFAVPGQRRRFASMPHLPLRLAVYSLLFLFWLGLLARPVFALTASVVTTAIFVGLSREKFNHLREPFVFSDFAFLSHLVRHPDLFYLNRRDSFILLVGSSFLAALIVGWSWFEPRTIPLWLQLGCLALLALLAAVVAFAPRLAARAVGRASRVAREAAATDFVQRLGLLGSVVACLAAWRATRIPPPDTREVAPVDLDAVVVIQAESFSDLRRHGAPLSLPALDRLKARALAHGRLAVSSYGAYTHRSEFAVTTGLDFLDQGLDRFHPYLRARRFAGHSLPAALARAGWDTVFLHPYDPFFFGRHRAIPQMGFARFLSETDFVGMARFGPYVSDAAVAERIRTELTSARLRGQPLYLMTVTMETHDPYGAGRIAATDDPVEQYAHHLAHADQLLASIVAELDARTERSILLFYGDHAPLLPGFEMLAEDTATDYIVLECGRLTPARAASSAPRPCSLAELNAILRWMLETR